MRGASVDRAADGVDPFADVVGRRPVVQGLGEEADVVGPGQPAVVEQAVGAQHRDGARADRDSPGDGAAIRCRGEHVARAL